MRAQFELSAPRFARKAQLTGEVDSASRQKTWFVNEHGVFDEGSFHDEFREILLSFRRVFQVEKSLEESQWRRKMEVKFERN